MSHYVTSTQIGKAERRTYQLRVPRGCWDLRDYVFQDDQHAREWMAQRFTEGYRAVSVIVSSVPCSCQCGGARHLRETIRRDKTRPDIVSRKENAA